MGVLASVGIISSKTSQSSSSVIGGTRTTLIVQPSATGGAPRFNQRMSAPSIAVGGGGRGAPGPQSNQPARSEEGSITEQIGKMVEDNQEHQPGELKPAGPQANKDEKTKEDHKQQPRNPKKRMWDEDVEAKKYEERQKDEL